MKIAILGFGSQGKSAYEYWNNSDNELTVCDSNETTTLPDNAKAKLGKNYLNNLSEYDLLIRTPALHPHEIALANPESPDILDKVWSNTNEFFKVCPTKNIIGVTGTKGKGTTSTLIAKMLEAAGKTVHLGGNIGIPPLEMLKNEIQPNDWVVLELANYQLIDLTSSPKIAVCLMVEPEHMDWHEDFTEYKAAKQNLFVHQQADDIAIYYNDNDNSKEIASAGQGSKIPYFAEPGAQVINEDVSINDAVIIEKSQIKLLGNHNLQNICAAITAFWQISKDKQAIHWTVETFSGLEHRLELVAEVAGVTFYDDSFGTTPDTAVVAIEAFEQPKVVVLGGSDKKANYEKLARTVKNHNVRAIVVIGHTAQAIEQALKDAGFLEIFHGGDSMKEILATAISKSETGDVLLLSPACASFGLFDNYKDRGDQFKQAVLEYAQAEQQLHLQAEQP